MNMLRVLCFFLFLGFSQLGFSAGKPSRRDGVVFVQEYGFYATNFNSINSINAPGYVGALHVSSCHLLVIEDPDGAFALAHLTAAQLSHEEAHKALPNGLRAMLASFQTNGGRIDKARFSIYGGGFDEAKRIKKRNFLKKIIQKINPDIVHTHLGDASRIMSKSWGNFKLVATCHMNYKKKHYLAR